MLFCDPTTLPPLPLRLLLRKPPISLMHSLSVLPPPSSMIYPSFIRALILSSLVVSSSILPSFISPRHRDDALCSPAIQQSFRHCPFRFCRYNSPFFGHSFTLHPSSCTHPYSFILDRVSILHPFILHPFSLHPFILNHLILNPLILRFSQES